MIWKPDSWRQCQALHQPSYADLDALHSTLSELTVLPGLVFAEEVKSLRADLARVERGEGFLLQGGDCAESFADFSEPQITDMVKVILQMAVALTYAGSCPVVKMGRVAGQFAKPRSSPVELRDGRELPSYLGDIINGLEFTECSRIPDPGRMLLAYRQSLATMHLMRGMTTGGFASLRNVKTWNLASVKATALSERYGAMSDQIHQALDFMEACGLPMDTFSSMQGTALYTSHEALLLEYERALLREVGGSWYGLSAHSLWIGERTRQLEGAHVEFLRGVENPIGIKLGPTVCADDCLRLMDRINPDNEVGKLMLICRMGADQVKHVLPSLLKRVKEDGRAGIWVCDPMHGNTETTAHGHKTRDFDRIVLELQHFFAAHAEAGTYPGGLHLEMTGRYVTECTGGAYSLSADDLHECYQTQCDPRLNAGQSLEVAYRVADELRAFRHS